ncbi:hypothetical protein [Brevibacillus dissolubilis]|uniref:hypothetical protein n=1 Tax=Brevibacillus dissolubilis TaxID=1844116 RepID=UPI0011172ACB|nr:hypothetical protein [Brevibacillus dissolubilis]
MNSLTHILQLTARESYKNLMTIILLNLTVLILLSPGVLLLHVYVAVAYLILLIGPLMLALTYETGNFDDYEKVTVKGFLKTIPKYAGKGILFGGAMCFFALIVGSAWWYHANTGSQWTFVLACFQTYFVGMIFISQLYTMPLLTQYGYTLKDSMFASVKLFIRHPLYTLGACLQLWCLAAALLFTVVGFLFLYPAIYTTMTNNLTRNVLMSDRSRDLPV